MELMSKYTNLEWRIIMKNRKVIFLDIDGVLQRFSSKERFNHDLEQLVLDMAEKYNNPHYLKMDKYDIGAVYYDWDNRAVKNLKEILLKTGAELVISSGWQYDKLLEDFKCLLIFHELDSYVTDITQKELYTCPTKHEDIQNYLDEHDNILNYVVIDDADMQKYFPGHFVSTYSANYLNDEAKELAIKILNEE